MEQIHWPTHKNVSQLIKRIGYRVCLRIYTKYSIIMTLVTIGWWRE
jgi:hypothetical protein